MKRTLLFACAGLATLAFGNEIVLKGGTRIEAPVIKQTDDAMIVDLDFDVLRIPKSEILSVFEKTATAELPIGETSENSLYSVATPERLTTSEATKLYAPSVVLVKTPAGLGSGFFINKEGYLITNTSRQQLDET
jgi:serine protease Do